MSYDSPTEMKLRVEVAERTTADLLAIVKQLTATTLHFRVDATETVLSPAGEAERKHLAETIAAAAARSIESMLESRVKLHREICELRLNARPFL